MRYFILILAAFALANPVHAQSVNPGDLDSITKEQLAAKKRAETIEKEQEKIRAQIDRYKADLQNNAREASGIERKSRDIANSLAELNAQEATLTTELSADRQSLSETLAALQRIEANPPPSVLMAPDNARDAVTAAGLMGALSTQLKERAALLQDKINAIARLREDITVEQDKLARNELSLSKKRDTIKSIVSEKTQLDAKLGKSREAEKARANALAAKAADLKDLIAQFEATASDIRPRVKPRPESETTPTPPPTRRGTKPVDLPDGTIRFAEAQDGLQSPVQGRVKSRFGGSREGVTITTRAKAQVLSPYAGRVEFAGTFKTYGEVVILNVGEDYFILLTGLGEVFVNSGEMVSRGEPVGLMPFNTQNAPELYIEFRRSGRTINPAPWLDGLFAG